MKEKQLLQENLKFEEVVCRWLENAKMRVKESSYVKYTNLIQNHILPDMGQLPVCELTTDTVEQFVKKKLSNGKKNGTGGLSEKTVKDMLTLLKEISNYAAFLEIRIPCHFELIKVRKKEKEAKILEAAEQKTLEQCLMRDEEFTKTGVLLSLYMGLRIGEVCALKRQHILYKEEILQVRLTMQRIQNLDSEDGKKTKIIVTEPKSCCSVRDIPIPPFLMGRLEKLKNMPDSAYLLTGSSGEFIEPRTMENIFKRYLRECGIRTVNFHALRHTFATRCIENGFDVKTVSEILGHANVNITLNRYVHSSIEQKRKSMNRLIPYVSQNKKNKNAAQRKSI